MRDESMNLGIMIKKARRNKHLTQVQLAEDLSISTRYMQAIENEGKNPSYELLKRMLAYLNLSADLAIYASESDKTESLERLQYLIEEKCSSRDILVLLATAEALTAPATSID